MCGVGDGWGDGVFNSDEKVRVRERVRKTAEETCLRFQRLTWCRYEVGRASNRGGSKLRKTSRQVPGAPG